MKANIHERTYYTLCGVLRDLAREALDSHNDAVDMTEQDLADIDNELRDGATSFEYAVRVVTGIIYDGYAYGNWPWVINLDTD
jgi:hypothetical protein